MRAVALIVVCAQMAASQTWVIKVSSSATVLGDALASNPLDSRILYGAPGGRQLYVSRNRGYSWQSYGTSIPNAGPQENAIKSIDVNPHDTLQIVLGVESANSNPDRIMKSTDGGATWTQTWGGSFAYYGKPVEFKPIHPDTMYTMGNDTIWRSTDFGTTWEVVRTTVGLFNAWCDAELRPDSANVMFLGDFGSGIWKTYDYGHNWKKVYTSGGETPSIAIDPFHPRIMYATQFSGGGGVLKSTDWGETWNSLPTPLGSGPGWWITCSTVDTGYVYFGVYGATPAGIYVSADYGNSWRLFNTGFSQNGLINYGLLALDSLTVVASQINGIWRLQYPPSLQLSAPNGGEVLHAGVPHPVSWTAANLYSLLIESSTDGGATWTTLKDSVPPNQSPYSWTPPEAYSSACRVRVTDDILPYISSASAANFTVYVDPLSLHYPRGGERWSEGSARMIEWLSYEIPSVRLEYSVDNGSLWTYITKVAGGAGSYKWVVPDNPSTQCRVRITDAGDSSVFKISDSAFTITKSAAYSGTLYVSDNGSGIDSLRFGAESGATDGIDPSWGETALGPGPGAGTFDARWRIPSGEETRIDFRDTLGNSHTSNTFVAGFQPGPGGYPMMLSWNPESLAAGTFILRDTLTRGSRYAVDMRNAAGVTITDSSVGAVEIVQCRSVWHTYQGNGGWLLLSLPLDVGDPRKSTLFPNALSSAFAYHGGYVRSDTLIRGFGYWLRSEQVTVIGCPVASDTAALSAGWNMIGAPSTAISASSVSVVPGDILTSKFFGYDQSYYVADSLTPGSGYWIRCGGPGTLVLSAGPSALSRSAARRGGASAQRTPIRPSPLDHEASAMSGLHTLTVSDGAGHRQELFFGVQNSGINADSYDMPPPPPQPAFDARFGARGMVLLHPARLAKPANYPLTVSGVTKSINFSYDVDNERNFTYILAWSLGGKEGGEVRLAGRNSAVVEYGDGLSVTLRVEQGAFNSQMPGAYALSPVYPNPFNPATHFTYSIPADARVEIRVYDILGSEVTTLVQGLQPAGVYDAEWTGSTRDGSQAASGVYYIRMRASSLLQRGEADRAEFSGVRKALLIR